MKECSDCSGNLAACPHERCNRILAIEHECELRAALAICACAKERHPSMAQLPWGSKGSAGGDFNTRGAHAASNCLLAAAAPHLRTNWNATCSTRSPMGMLCNADTALAADMGSSKLTNPQHRLLPESSWRICMPGVGCAQCALHCTGGIMCSACVAKWDWGATLMPWCGGGQGWRPDYTAKHDLGRLRGTGTIHWLCCSAGEEMGFCAYNGNRHGLWHLTRDACSVKMHLLEHIRWWGPWACNFPTMWVSILDTNKRPARMCICVCCPLGRGCACVRSHMGACTEWYGCAPWQSGWLQKAKTSRTGTGGLQSLANF